MARHIITEADVERWVKQAGVTEVVLQDHDTVTALARDTAHALGLRFVESAAAEPATTAPVVTAAVSPIDVALLTRIVTAALARTSGGET